MSAVLQITPALDAGGVERTTIEVAEAIVNAGGRALVASRGGRLEEELKAVGGELFRMGVDTKDPLGIWRNVDRIAALAEQEKAALIHARSRAPAWSAYYAAKRLNLPFVTTYHGIYNARTPFKKAYNAIMAKGDTVIANSNYTRDHIIKRHKTPKDRVVAIPRGVDYALFDPARVDPERRARARLEMGVPAEDPRPIVLLPARLSPWKGQMTLIEAAALLSRRRPGAARFVLAGDAQGRDHYVAQLQKQIRIKGLQPLFTLPGHVADMPAAFAAADIAVFPSLEPEAFGRGAVEAQAMGVAVIAAGHGGLAETVVDGETGLLVPPGDARRLADALEQLLTAAPERRAAIGAAGARHVRARYSKENLQRATLDVYAQLITKEAP